MEGEMRTHSDRPVQRTGRKGAETAARILDVAEDLFSKQGFAGTTLRDISTRVGLRNSSLYNHFTSKEELYAAVLERGVRPILELFARIAARGEEGYDDPSFSDEVVELLARHPNLPRLIQYEVLTGGEHLQVALAKWIVPLFAKAGSIIEQGPAGRRFDREEITLIAFALYNMVAGYFTLAPLFKAMNGKDLLSEETRAKQARLMREFIGAFFRNEPVYTQSLD